MSLLPGDHVLLEMKNGDGKLRHCVILTEADETNHLVLTVSRAMRDVDFSDRSVSRILLFDGTVVPVGIAAGDCVLDSSHARGKFTKEEVDCAMREADDEGPRPAPGLPGGPPRDWPSGGGVAADHPRRPDRRPNDGLRTNDGRLFLFARAARKRTTSSSRCRP